MNRNIIIYMKISIQIKFCFLDNKRVHVVREASSFSFTERKHIYCKTSETN